MIYLVPGRQNLSIISLFPTASQETACLFNAVFGKVQCCMRRSKGRGKGIRNPPPPWKIQTYQIYMLKLPSPPPPQTRLQSPPLGKWFLIRAWCSQTNFDNLRTSTDFFFSNNRLIIIFFSLHNSKKIKEIRAVFYANENKVNWSRQWEPRLWPRTLTFQKKNEWIDSRLIAWKPSLHLRKIFRKIHRYHRIHSTFVVNNYIYDFLFPFSSIN